MTFLSLVFNFSSKNSLKKEREREKRRKSVTKLFENINDIDSRSEGIIPSKTNRKQVQAPLLLTEIFYISF